MKKKVRRKIISFLLLLAVPAAGILLLPAVSLQKSSAAQNEAPAEGREEETGETPGSEGGDMTLILTAADAASAETVNLTVGEEIFYENYSTNYFDVDGKTAYCLEPLKDTPQSGSYEVTELGSGLLRKGLYYMYGGPGYEVYREKFGLIGMGAEFSTQDEYCMSHCILSYLYSGSEEAFTGLSAETAASLKGKAENLSMLDDPPEAFYAFLFNIGGDGQTMGGVGEDHTGRLEIYKSSSEPQLTEGNLCYSLEKAEFSIYRCGGQEAEWTVRTNADGYAALDNIPAGTYEIAETAPPEGYAVNSARQVIHITDSGICRYDCPNRPQYRPAGLLAQKKDAETGLAVPQGGAVLENAEFRVDFYGGYYSENPASQSAAPLRSWVLRTDKNGKLSLDDSLKTGGDEFYRNKDGSPVLPLGTITIQEIKAPEGYLLNETVFTEQITAAGPGVTDTVLHESEVKENVIRGDLCLIKILEDTDPEEELKTSLEGIVFTIRSNTTGEEFTVTTDRNGYASTRKGEKGSLPFDTYTVHESNTPAGLKPADDFEVTVTEQGQMLSYIIENKQILSPVRLVKTDAETGNVIPLAGACFRLLDQNKNPIKMTVYYPKKEETDQFETDESGMFMLPEKLPAGVYYFEELSAPEGYVRSEEPVRFEITEAHNWEEPFQVVFQDYPVRRGLRILKQDAETGNPLPQVVFEILAARDIVTPDGTVKLKEGETAAQIETDETGCAQADGLYPGLYEIREIQQAPGYVRQTEAAVAELKCDGQEKETVEQTVTVENSPVRVTVRKTEYGTGQPLEGAEFILETEDGVKDDAQSGAEPDGAEEAEEQEDLETEEEADRFVTDENGEITFCYLQPGAYRIREVKSPVGYASGGGEAVFTVSEDGTVDGETDRVFVLENRKTVIKDTHAYWSDSKSRTAVEGKSALIVDEVELENLEPGKEYRLMGVVADRESGRPIQADGKQIVSEKVFTADQSNASVSQQYTVDTSGFGNRSLVIFEYLYEMEKLISSHEDPDDADQTVTVIPEEKPVPEEKAPEEKETVATGDPGTGRAVPWLLSVSGLSAAAGTWTFRRLFQKNRRRKNGKKKYFTFF